MQFALYAYDNSMQFALHAYDNSIKLAWIDKQNNI